MWAHQARSYGRETPPEHPSGPDRGATHDHHHHRPDQGSRRRRRGRRDHLRRRPDQPPADGRRLGAERRLGAAQLGQGGDERARVGRHHRYVPAVAALGRPRPGRLPALRRRLPAHVRRRGDRRDRPADGGRLRPGVRERRPGGRRRRRPGGRPRWPADGARPVRRRLPGRWPAVRHRAVPRRRPGPLGVRAARRGHRRHRGARRPAGGVQPALRRPRRHRADRARDLAVAPCGRRERPEPVRPAVAPVVR